MIERLYRVFRNWQRRLRREAKARRDLFEGHEARARAARAVQLAYERHDDRGYGQALMHHVRATNDVLRAEKASQGLRATPVRGWGGPRAHPSSGAGASR